MTNAWSLLYDELKMSENFETTYESSIPKQELPYPYEYNIDGNVTVMSDNTINLTYNSHPQFPGNITRKRL
jgi:hypothetical protein